MSAYDYEDDDFGEGRSVARVIGTALVVVAVALLGWFVGRPMLADESSATSVVSTAEDSTGVSSGSSEPPPSIEPAASSEPDATGTATSTSSVAPSSAVTNTTRERTNRTKASRATTTSHPRPTTTQAIPYPTLPDGTPEPVIATFDVNTITLTGVVPSRAAADRLGALALANSKTPAELVNLLTINPNVPTSVGVRVIELTSFRFPESSAVILPEHALEFDRVATVMEALPNVTVLVIGHADQRGTPEDNFALSEARARAAVGYLVGRGIDPDRLSSRAVGATDLLNLNSDETAFALNRRTEFVFYGLIADT